MTSEEKIVEGYAYRNRPELYLKVYDKDFTEYPDQRIRLEITKKILSKYKIDTVLDVGCGSAVPLYELLQLGYNIQGIDINPQMIQTGQKFLKDNDVDPKRIMHTTLEKSNTGKFDAIINLGAFPHEPDDDSQLRLHGKFLNKGGKLVMELRNELFALSTFNSYSYKLMQKLFQDNIEDVDEFIKSKFSLDEPREHFTDPYYKTNPRLHNPLTIGEILNKNEFTLDKIHFYHFHCMPPVLEKSHSNFIKDSLKLENPSDWRGYFLASAFLIEATKR